MWQPDRPLRARRGTFLRGVAGAATLAWVVMTPVLGAETFAFAHTPGDRYRIVTRVDENVFRNGRFLQRVDILNKIGVHVAEVRADGAGLLESSFQTTERGYGQATTYGPLDEIYESTFWRTPDGRLEIAPRYIMPIVRNVPFFPDRELEPGDTWVAEGEEVHDFSRNFGVVEPFRFPIRVAYAYEGNERYQGREVAALRIEYDVFHRVPAVVGQSLTSLEKITGQSQQRYLWDFASGRAIAYEESFEFDIHVSTGDVYTFRGTSSGELIDVQPLDRERVAAEIREDLAAGGVADASVTADEEGVTITLDNVQFPPNSPLLVPAEQDKLRRIGTIVRRFPARDVLITGHTARVGTEQSSQILSEQRARAVGDFLLSIGARTAESMVFRGLGSRRPLADNATEAGRRRNRRVEITILEN